MKIITWNINGIRSIIGQNPSRRYDKVTKENKLFAYLEKEDPDILCMQETKAFPDQIDEDKRSPEGYEAFYNSCSFKKGYSGVGVYTKIKPQEVHNGFGIEKYDREGRVIQMDFGDFVLFNVYFPKGYADHERLDYKLDFYDDFFKYVDTIRAKGREVIISGDYNTAHKEIDLARPKQNTGTSGFIPVERERLDRLVETGWVDTFRMFTEEGGHYTWWSQRGRARENNVGWRIDYHFATEKIAGKIKDAYQQPEQAGSDHCPVVIKLDI